MREAARIGFEMISGECKLTKMSKTPDKEPNENGSWGIGMYSTKGDGNADGYGFYRPENPNNFWPDYECCEPWEIENHKLAIKKYDEAVNDPSNK